MLITFFSICSVLENTRYLHQRLLAFYHFGYYPLWWCWRLRESQVSFLEVLAQSEGTLSSQLLPPVFSSGIVQADQRPYLIFTPSSQWCLQGYTILTPTRSCSICLSFRLGYNSVHTDKGIPFASLNTAHSQTYRVQRFFWQLAWGREASTRERPAPSCPAFCEQQTVRNWCQDGRPHGGRSHVGLLTTSPQPKVSADP